MSARLLTVLALIVPLFASADTAGKRWFQLPSRYLVFAHASVNGVADFAGTVLPAVHRGFQRWTTEQVACTSWAVEYLGHFSTPANASAIRPDDTLNRVIWLGGVDWKYDSLTLGMTTTTFYPDTGEIVDADMELNNNVPWKVGGGGQANDVESVITHEAGHYLGLLHTAATSAVMFERYDPGTIKTALTEYDVNDVCSLYPKAAGTGQGAPCTSDPECLSGLVCRGKVGTSNSRICTQDCGAGQACGGGYTCQSAEPGGQACLPPVGAPDLCRFCTSGTGCLSGICASDGPRSWCTISCQSAAACGPGYTCEPLGATKVCVPQSSTCPAPQCSTASQCPVGYACTGGMCQATGAAGDRCEVSLYCQSCLVCVGNLGQAFCQPCCGATGPSGACASCGSPTCPAGSTCYNLDNGQDQACVPTGAASCQYCDASTPCHAGLTCTYGRCHAACNPDSPGACAACLRNADGSGLCACSGEIAYVGQSCGPSSSGRVFGCVNGTSCVGTPKTCRQRCDLQNPKACDPNYKCTPLEGVNVCVPQFGAMQLCGRCDGTSCHPGYTCYAGRCYRPCNPAAPDCSTCVGLADGRGVCACDDQQSAPGGVCGSLVIGPRYCTPGSRCVGHTCYLECNPAAPSCFSGETCQGVDGIHVCAAPGTDFHPDATTDAGCGCGSRTGPSWLVGLIMICARFTKRRRSRFNPEA